MRNRKEKGAHFAACNKENSKSTAIILSPFVVVGLFSGFNNVSLLLAIGLSTGLGVANEIIKCSSRYQYSIFGASEPYLDAAPEIFLDMADELRFG